MAIMYRKSLAGAIRVIFSVSGFGADSPEIVCVFWKFAMFVAVGLCDFIAKYAVS